MGHDGLEAFRATHQADIDRADALIKDYADEGSYDEDALPSNIINWFIGIEVGMLAHRSHVFSQFTSASEGEMSSSILDGLYEDLGNNSLIDDVRDSWNGPASDAFFSVFIGADTGGYSLKSYLDDVHDKFEHHYDQINAKEGMVGRLRECQDKILEGCNTFISGLDDRWMNYIASEFFTLGIGWWTSSAADELVGFFELAAFASDQASNTTGFTALLQSTVKSDYQGIDQSVTRPVATDLLDDVEDEAADSLPGEWY